MLDDLQAQAKSLDATYRKSVQDVTSNDGLTPNGKAEAIAQLDAKRRQQVAALQSEAQRRISAQRTKLAQDAATAKAAEIDRQRQLLGDAAMLHLYQRRISMRDSAEIAQMLQNAANDYERELVRQLGLLELESRTGAPGATRQDFSAMMELRQSSDSAQDDGISQAETIAAQLDLAAYRRDAGDRLNVDSRFVPDPF
jgi:G3E family GTPase